MLRTWLNIRSSTAGATLWLLHQSLCVSRKQRRREHPTSPNKYRKCSRRCFDGQLRTWRRNLHQFDEGNEENHKEESADLIEESDTQDIDPPMLTKYELYSESFESLPVVCS